MRHFKVFNDQAGIGAYLLEVIKESSKAAIEQRGRFCMAISGGSLLDILANAHLGAYSDIDFDKWNIFLVDERYVTPHSPDSNYGALLAKLVNPESSKIKSAKCFPVNTAQGIEEACAEYRRLLQDEAGRLDLCLLGMGPDGHTASLFPGNAGFDPADPSSFVIVKDSPKPPSNRLSMTIGYINHSRLAVVTVMGSEKKEAIYSIFNDSNNSLPASYITKEALWLLDTGAASTL